MDRRLGALVNIIRELRHFAPPKSLAGPVAYEYEGVRWVQTSRRGQPVATCPEHKIEVWYERNLGNGQVSRVSPFERAVVSGSYYGRLVCPDGGDHWLKATWQHPFGTMRDQAGQLMAKLWD